jgi:hypothetical protein
MIVAFHCNQLSLRGTEVAVYDYAHYNETILGNESIIIVKHSPLSHHLTIEKFRKRFSKIFFYFDSFDEVEEILIANNVDVLYMIKAGFNDGNISKKVKTVIHSVFQHYEPHGNVYAYVSEWLGNNFGMPWVPHMVDLPDEKGDLREQLEIPKTAIVYGRHGGYETFDLAYVKEAVIKTASWNPEIFFLFLNTEKFSPPDIKNIIYLEPIADLHEKVKFINTCDAMLHGRKRGESFGLSVGEFSIKNKPVITCRNADEQAHFAVLRNNGVYYSHFSELMTILNQHAFLDENVDWNCYREYTPEKVMEKFKQIFLS